MSESSISFPTYNEELIEARRYNIMSHFHCFLPDDIGINQLLYYSVKLAEDLKEAEKRNKQQASEQRAANAAAGRQGNRGASHSGPGPVRWKRRR